MATDIELLLPRVLRYAAACPEPIAVDHIRDAAIEFCKRTRVWRDRDTFAVSASDCEAIVPLQNADVYEIAHASFDEGGNKRDLEAKAMDWLDRHEPGWRDEEGNPSIITQVNPNTLRVVGKTAGQITLELILIPSAKCQVLPDILVNKYAAEISWGAIGEVLLTPGDFINPELGSAFAQRFQGALDRYGAKISRGQQKAPQRTVGRYV